MLFDNLNPFFVPTKMERDVKLYQEKCDLVDFSWYEIEFIENDEEEEVAAKNKWKIISQSDA